MLFFTEEFFTTPLLPLTLLYEVAKVFGCGHTPPEYIQSLELTESEKRNPRLLAHVWLCYILDINKESCHFLIRRFKAVRGSANSLIMRTANAHQLSSEPTATPQGHQVTPTPSPPATNTRVPNPDNNPPGFNSLPQNGKNTDNAHLQGPLDHPIPQQNIRIEGNEVTIAGLPTHNNDHSRKANYVQVMFKESKITGELSQDIHQTLQMYSICARQYTLSQAQKSDFFVHPFNGAARKVFLHHTNDEMRYDEKAQTMLQEYVSDACQLQVKGTLETLCLRTFMADKNINDVSEGRTKIVEHINAMTPQCPPDFRSDTHKIDYLRRAVTEFQSWSRLPIQNITSQR